MPDNVKLLAAIDAYASQSLGGNDDDGELSRQRSLALDAYAGKMLDVPPKGGSKVNDRAVFETVQWIMPSMMRIFAGGDNVVEFDPIGPDDEEKSEQESDYLNYLVTQKNDWELTVREWCQDALLTKNAYCLVDMEEVLIPEVEHYEGKSEEQVTLILEDDMEVVGQKQYDDPDDEGLILDPITKEPIDPEDQATLLGAQAIYQASGQEPERVFKQLFDIDVRRVEAIQRLRFEVLPPEHCKVGEDSKDFTLESDNYFEYWGEMTLSNLRKLGYEVDDDLASGNTDNDTQEDTSRDEPLQSMTDIDNPDPAMKTVIVRTIWIRHDYDDDGIAELQKVVLVGEEILEHEPASRIPVACIVPFINTHRHFGNSIADLVYEIQRIKTSLLRSGLDSLKLAGNPGHVISDQVNRDDMMTSRSGRLVRLKKGALPSEGHVTPLQTENTFPHILQGLQHMDTVIEARAGVNRMFQGIDASNVNDYDRIGQLSTMAAQRIEDIARLFGSGFKRLFSLAHELVIKSGRKQETIKLRGKWVEIDPTQWRTGRDMRVVAPYAAGNKDSLVQRIMLHMGVHEKALAGGLPIVDAQDSYNLALELAKATDLPGTKIYTDPSTIPPKEPKPDHTAMALEIENKKADNSAADSELDAEVKKYEVDTDARVKIETAEISSNTQIAVAKLKGGQSIELEGFKSDLKNAPVTFDNEAVRSLTESVEATVNELNRVVQEIKEVSEAPIKIVRKDGKIVGKEVNGRFVSIEEAS